MFSIFISIMHRTEFKLQVLDKRPQIPELIFKINVTKDAR